jgi:hypothetical protein
MTRACPSPSKHHQAAEYALLSPKSLLFDSQSGRVSLDRNKFPSGLVLQEEHVTFLQLDS